MVSQGLQENEVTARREEVSQNTVFTRICIFELSYLLVVAKILILCKKIKPATPRL